VCVRIAKEVGKDCSGQSAWRPVNHLKFVLAWAARIPSLPAPPEPA